MEVQLELQNSIANGLGCIYQGSISFPNPAPPPQTITPGELWPAGNPAAWAGMYPTYFAAAEKGGSWNWPGDAVAAAYLCGSPAQQAEADQDALNFLSIMKTTWGWMGQETVSTVYAELHLDYALVFLRRGSAAVQALALEWLDLFALILRYTWDPRVQRTLFYGQRSAEPGRNEAGITDQLAAYLVDAAPFPTGNTIDMLIFSQLRPEIDQVKARPLANPV